MAIEKAKIPSRRDRLQVSPERRDQARAGMGGEQVRTAGTTVSSADAAPAPLEPTPAPVAAPEPTATAPALDNTPTPSSPSEPAAEPTPAQAVAAVDAPVAVARTAAPATGPRRGRKPAPPDAVLMEPERSVKIPESVWEDIKLTLAQLLKSEGSPNNIKAYLVAAHRLYDGQLRKQGKLPAKQAEGK